MSSLLHRISYAFSPFAKKEFSTEALEREDPYGALHIRGNVYARLGGILSKKERKAYLDAGKKVSTAYKESKGDIECFLKKLRAQ